MAKDSKRAPLFPSEAVKALKKLASAGPLPDNHPLRKFATAWQNKREREIERELLAQATRRRKRKGVGGAPKTLTPKQIEAAQSKLRQMVESGECRKLADLKAWIIKQKWAASDTTLRRHVIWPVLGRNPR